MENEYESLEEFLEENYEEIEDSVYAYLEDTSEEYQALLHETSEMDAKYPFIWQTLYGEGEITLTEKEHAILFDYLMMENEIRAIERQALYVRGLADSVDLFE